MHWAEHPPEYSVHVLFLMSIFLRPSSVLTDDDDDGNGDDDMVVVHAVD